MFTIPKDVAIWYDIKVNNDIIFELINKYKTPLDIVDKIKNQGFFWFLVLKGGSHITITNSLLDLLPISSNFMLDVKGVTNQSVKFTSKSIETYHPIQKKYKFDGDIIEFLNKKGTPC